jgi:hypothetical protein
MPEPDFDADELLAAIDAIEERGVSPGTVAWLRATVRAEAWGWAEPRRWSSGPRRYWRSRPTTAEHAPPRVSDGVMEAG